MNGILLDLSMGPADLVSMNNPVSIIVISVIIIATLAILIHIIKKFK